MEYLHRNCLGIGQCTSLNLCYKIDRQRNRGNIILVIRKFSEVKDRPGDRYCCTVLDSSRESKDIWPGTRK